VQGIRKIGRAIMIVVLALAGSFLLIEGMRSGAPVMPVLLGLGALLGAFGLVATWFFPTS
jgi:hypothetical protein